MARAAPFFFRGETPFFFQGAAQEILTLDTTRQGETCRGEGAWHENGDDARYPLALQQDGAKGAAQPAMAPGSRQLWHVTPPPTPLLHVSHRCGRSVLERRRASLLRNSGCLDLDQKRSLSSAFLVTTAEPRRRAQGGIALAAAALTLCLPAARRETRREAPQLSSTRDIDELPPPLPSMAVSLARSRISELVLRVARRPAHM